MIKFGNEEDATAIDEGNLYLKLVSIAPAKIELQIRNQKTKKTEKLRENSTIFRESEENPDEKSQGLA